MSKQFSNAMLKNMFRPVENVVWDMTTGRVGFQGKDGIVSIELTEVKDEEGNVTDTEAQITVNPFEEFGMAVPAFAQSVPASDIKIGDMIYTSSSDSVAGWVIAKKQKSFTLMKKDGTNGNWTPPKVKMLGFDSGVMVLRNLMNMLPGGGEQLGQMQSSLMPMIMMSQMGGGEMDMTSIMPMMLFSQINGIDTNGGGDGGGNNMMQTMMMMQMMGGDSGSMDMEKMMPMMLMGGMGGGGNNMMQTMMMMQMMKGNVPGGKSSQFFHN